MIDAETSYKSLLFVTESLEQLIGANGSKAVLRMAGQKAATNLIDMLPLSLPEGEAVRRAGLLLVELGFMDEMSMLDADHLQVAGNHVLRELHKLGLESTSSGGYYVVGLFEGFFRQLSDSTRKVVSMELKEGVEHWKLG